MFRFVLFVLFLVTSLANAEVINLQNSTLDSSLSSPISQEIKSDYTLLNANEYQQTVGRARSEVTRILNVIQTQNQKNKNTTIDFIVKQFLDLPYLSQGALGEGDWQTNSLIYQPGGIHIKQDPVYRFDGFDCQTFVQVVIALYYAHNLDEFDQTLLKIAYGAAGESVGLQVHYYNRNHFIDGDWNPINQKNNFLSDASTQAELKPYVKTQIVNLTRQNWFLQKQKNPNIAIRVLSDENGIKMAEYFKTTYSNLNFPNFEHESLGISYIPKASLALEQTDGSYLPNKKLLDKLPTPAVLEIIRDPKLWMIGGKTIKESIGSELSVSHMGILYRKTYTYHEIIYQKTQCKLDENNQKVCLVTPVRCEKQYCNELIFTHASDGKPSNYYWSKKPDGNYTCTAKLPEANIPISTCNRVQTIPLYDYLTDYQYGSYLYMKNPSIVGVHIERLN